MNRKTGMHASKPWFQISNRTPTINHKPTISNVTFKNTNAQAPTNFEVNSSDRETGLLNSSVIDPGSNICGMTFDVMSNAATNPKTPTIQSIALVNTHSLMNESICFFEKGSGSL